MRVVSLWRYPVKSMQGEELEIATIDDLGITGDRQWALVDLGTGLALTARRVPELLFASGPPRRRSRRRTSRSSCPTARSPPTTPRCRRGWAGTSSCVAPAPASTGRFEIAADFEDEAGSPWFQWDGPDGTFHDSGRTRVSVLGTGSIGAWDRRRFRGNVLVETDGVGDEEALVEHRVTLGSAVLDVVKPIDRCVMTTRPQPGGIERDLDVLRTINAERATYLGVGTLDRAPGEVEGRRRAARARPRDLGAQPSAASRSRTSARASRRPVDSSAAAATGANLRGSRESPAITSRSAAVGWNATTGMPRPRSAATSRASDRRAILAHRASPGRARHSAARR